MLHGQDFPAGGKVVSLFEPHAGVKGGRDVQYGHKLNLLTGRRTYVRSAVVADNLVLFARPKPG